ncbi:autotransporter beta-domain protein [Campylobacter jejuni subsp. doylei 269.97]|uniref:Autotransporter beta-domain protein n=2 Tax=Campylobacter jejuni subsp. doylei TaxID=32021 RepID=A7H4I2_CAMJD|nr:autotransporter beta-domain protein [Campylobacter jejuni subsp. doylei 269.97]AVL47635.1 autotransporter [Campylobacter jejuni subsp. doylei]
MTITKNGTLMNSGSTVNPSSAIVLKPSNSSTPTLTLINEGTINSRIDIENNNGFSGTITVKKFENKGTINERVFMGGDGSGTISIENFNNEGFIKGYESGTDSYQGVRFEGNVHVGTFENKNKGTIEGKNGNYAILLIGTNSSTPTLENFNNEGFIKGEIGIGGTQGFRGTVTVKTFENKNGGTIDGGIYIPASTGTISIENFNNTGTIKGGNYQGVYFQGDKVHIKTFENKGFISGSAYDMIYKNFNVSGGVSMAGGTIDTFINKGTIQSTGTNHNPAGVKLNYATVKTFENTGFISGTIGVLATQGTIETFKNSGTIEATGKDGHEAAIQIRSAFKNSSSITHFTNEGIIKSKSHGVLIESGDKIETLTNKGTIETELNGIGFYNYTGSEETHLGKIILESDSSIKAGKNGIDIDNQTTARSIRVGGIEVQKGASVSGDEAGIYLGKDKEITAPITISGTVSGGNAGIVNEGRMARGITHNGEAELVISNQGLVGKDDKGNTVTNNKGSVTIKDWVVTTNEEGKLDTVVIGGEKTENVQVSNITVDQSGLELEELNEIKNLISGVSTNNIANVKTNGGGEISLSYDPISARLSTDVQLNASIAGANFRSSVATASKRATFIDNVMANAMQSFSLDSSGKSQKIALSEKGNLYADASDYIKNDYIKNDYIKSDLTQANYGLNKEHALFILPYLSSQSVELSLNEESKGHTKGTIIGYSTLKDSGIYGVYAGYEDTKMDSTYFDVNNISYYTGLKYFNTLFTTAKGQEVYIKAQAQAALIKNDFTKRIGKNEAKAKAHSYTYGIHTALGMNFIADKNIFSPEAGFAYEGSYTEAFSMQDTRGQATVRGGERTYANHLNLFSTKTSFTWFRDWLPNLKTSVELGAKFNVNPKVKARARFGNMKVNDEFHLPRVRKFASTSLIVPVNEAFYFSLNYNGMFDEKGNTHTGFAQFNYLW